MTQPLPAPASVLADVRAFASRQTQHAFLAAEVHWVLANKMPGAWTARGRLSRRYVTGVRQALDALTADGMLAARRSSAGVLYALPDVWVMRDAEAEQLAAAAVSTLNRRGTS